MKRGSTTAELSICKRLAIARLKAGKRGTETQPVKGFSICIILRCLIDPEEGPSKTTKSCVITSLCYIVGCICMSAHWDNSASSSCVQSCSMFIYVCVSVCTVLLPVLTTSFDDFVILHCNSYFVPSSVGCT